MFMDESTLDSDGKDSKTNDLLAEVNALNLSKSGESGHHGELGSAGALPGSAANRAKILQQQKEIQRKKMQERVGGGMVRAADNPTTTGSARFSTSETRRNPVQFSAPRDKNIDHQPSRLCRKDELFENKYNNEPNSPNNNHGYREDSLKKGYSKDYELDTDRERGYDRGYDRNHAGMRKGDSDWNDKDQGNNLYADENDSPFNNRSKNTYGDPNQRSDENSYRSDRDRPHYNQDRDHDRGQYRSNEKGGGQDSKSYDRNQDSKDYEKNLDRGKSYENGHSGQPRSSYSSENGRRDEVSAVEKNLQARGLSSTFDPTTTPEPEKKSPLDLSDMRSFLMRATPKSCGVVQCYIERNKSGANKLFPEYCLYLKDADRFLLVAKKRPQNKTSNYLISMQRGDLNRSSSNFLGKLRSNFIGTEFVLYDKGLNPKEVETATSSVSQSSVRQELGIAIYASNVLGSRGPRKMKVCIPRVREDGTRTIWRPFCKEDEMLTKCKEQDHTSLSYLINKPPRWNEQVGAYVLNFNGRVTMASVKNFQLVTPEDQETVVLQFGRVGKDLFTMDFQYPLCPFQAFAITLSSFDSKLACE